MFKIRYISSSMRKGIKSNLYYITYDKNLFEVNITDKADNNEIGILLLGTSDWFYTDRYELQKLIDLYFKFEDTTMVDKLRSMFKQLLIKSSKESSYV